MDMGVALTSGRSIVDRQACYFLAISSRPAP
jgi:hypothetical protein